MAAWRGVRIHRCRCSIRKSTPCSLSVMGYGSRLGNALHHLKALHVQLVASRSALVGTHFAGHNHARLLGQPLQRLKDLGGHALYVRHALHGPGAVAKDGKQQLAALAQVIEPSAQGNRLAYMLAQRSDGCYGLRVVRAEPGVAAAACAAGVFGAGRSSVISFLTGRRKTTPAGHSSITPAGSFQASRASGGDAVAVPAPKLSSPMGPKTIVAA